MASEKDPQKRTTSAAKDIDPQGLEGTSLGAAGSSQEAFSDAAKGRGPEDPRGPGQRELSAGSEQVRGTGSRNNLEPPRGMREGPDRQAHTERMANDNDQAKRQGDLDLIRRTQDGQSQGSRGIERDDRSI